MPAVQTFALYSAFAVLLDFILQITCFVSLISIDMRREEANRLDLICCVRVEEKSDEDDQTGCEAIMKDGIFYFIFNEFYAPFILWDVVRAIVVS